MNCERLETATAARTFLKDFNDRREIIMEKNSNPRLFIPVTVTVQGKDPAELMLPADSPAAKTLFAAAKDLGCDPSDLLNESIVKFYSRWHLILTLKLAQKKSGQKH